MKKILIAASIVFASLTSVAQKNEKVEFVFNEASDAGITVDFIGESNGKVYTFTSKKNFNTMPTNQKYTITVNMGEPISCMLFMYTNLTAVNIWYTSTVTGQTLNNRYAFRIHCE